MRTQIALNSEQHAQAKRKAAELGISMAAYIRRLIDQDLAAARPQADLNSIAGLVHSGGSDIAKERHDAVRLAVAERYDRKKI